MTLFSRLAQQALDTDPRRVQPRLRQRFERNTHPSIEAPGRDSSSVALHPEAASAATSAGPATGMMPESTASVERPVEAAATIPGLSVTAAGDRQERLHGAQDPSSRHQRTGPVATQHAKAGSMTADDADTADAPGETALTAAPELPQPLLRPRRPPASDATASHDAPEDAHGMGAEFLHPDSAVRAGVAAADAADEVHVHIGRIEVTASRESPAPRARRSRARAPMTLDEYLAKRGDA